MEKLFEPLAREIGIDLESTNYQLYDIAQFYANNKGVSQLHKKYRLKLIKLMKLAKHWMN